MSTLIRIPVDLRIPEQTGIGGNCYWAVQSGTVSQMGFWAFLGNTSGGSGTGIKATGGIVYGFVQVPSNVDPNSTPHVIVCLGAKATAGASSVWRVGTSEIGTGNTFDVTSWTHVNAQTWTGVTASWERKDLDFTMVSATTSNAILAIKIERDSDGTSGTDNMTALVGCFDVYLQVTATG